MRFLRIAPRFVGEKPGTRLPDRVRLEQTASLLKAGGTIVPSEPLQCLASTIHFTRKSAQHVQTIWLPCDASQSDSGGVASRRWDAVGNAHSTYSTPQELLRNSPQGELINFCTLYLSLLYCSIFFCFPSILQLLQSQRIPNSLLPLPFLCFWLLLSHHKSSFFLFHTEKEHSFLSLESGRFFFPAFRSRGRDGTFLQSSK